MSISSTRPRAGFSLLEMLIVLAIMAILAVMIVPGLSHTDGSRLRAAARLLQADLAFTQSDSIAHSDDLRGIAFDTAHDRYLVSAASAPDTPLRHPVAGTDYVVHYGTGPSSDLAGVRLSSLDVGGDDRLQFGPFGQLDQAGAATITLSAGARSLTLTVHADTGDAAIGNVD